MKKLSAGYTRLLVRVPEAYWLVRDYKVKRPGVLILDPQGRKIAAHFLMGDRATVTAGLRTVLRTAKKAKPAADTLPPQVTLKLRLRAPLAKQRSEPLKTFVRGLPGVSKATLKQRSLQVTMARLWADPGAILTGAKLQGITLTPDDHRRLTVKVTHVADTPTTLRNLMGLQRRTEGILVSAPDVARNRIRVLYRADTLDRAGVEKAVTAAGYTLKKPRGE